MTETMYLYKVPEGLTSDPTGSYIITPCNYQTIASFLENNLNLYIYDNQNKQGEPDTALLILDSKKIPEYISAEYYLEILNLILKINGDRSISFIDFKGLALCFNKENLINYYLSDLPDLIHQLREEKDWLLSGKVLLTKRALSVMKFLGFFKETCCPDYDHLRTLYVLNQTNVFVRP